jgi:hypothetical protein
MEDFDTEIKKFWANRYKGDWQILTDIIQQGDKRWFKATIVYAGGTLVTAHSDDFDPTNTNPAEELAILRAIKKLPPVE